VLGSFRFFGVTNRFRRLLWTSLVAVWVSFFVGVGVGMMVQHLTAAETHAGDASHAAPIAAAATVPTADEVAESKRLTGVFFSIYYAMTGVHAIHIVAGMGVLIWLLRRSLRGDFGPGYYGPVDFVGLYWHLVDLVWIYLFPLLYLIR
jgi:cytochrome c oxidase subunit 3